MADTSVWMELVGRGHVVAVHFPIALLIVAGMFEGYCALVRRTERTRVGAACLSIGAAFAVLAAWSGWVHSRTMGGSTLITTHLVLGFAGAGVAMLALIALLARRTGWYRGLTVLAALVVSVAGHFGGEITHGEGYFGEVIARLMAPGGTEVAGAKPQAAVVAASLVHREVKFPADGKIDFVRDVEPIFAQSCVECHGAERRRGSLRLDNKQAALGGGNSGKLFVAGDSKGSVLMKRVRGEGIQKRMPLDHAALPEEQVRILAAWVDQGGVWPDSASRSGGKEEVHWAYVKPVRPVVPDVDVTGEGKFFRPAEAGQAGHGWVRNPIDAFVLARLEKEGLKPSPEADRVTLARRVSLDLTGLPPTPEEVDAFVSDTRDDAYERLVDRLLASPHYGERWGRHWLDIARYADTNGYEKDRGRVIWPYRDWVIKAINDDLPYDQFVIQQMAGDMLPGATAEQKIATGFHRNTMFNEEGGIDVEEFRFEALVDRVRTTSTAFMGLTMHCAQCHNHKYDAISQKDYYRFMALMNNADEPTFDIPDSSIDAKRAEVTKQIEAVEAGYAAAFPAVESKETWAVGKVERFVADNGAGYEVQSDGSVLVTGKVPEKDTYDVTIAVEDGSIGNSTRPSPRPSPGVPGEGEHAIAAAVGSMDGATRLKLEAMNDDRLANKGPGRGAQDGNIVLSEVRLIAVDGRGWGRPVTIASAEAEFSQKDYEVAKAFDANQKTGWALAERAKGPVKGRWAIFNFKEPLPAGTKSLEVQMDQNFGKGKVMGRFRLSLGKVETPVVKDAAAQRKALLEEKLAAWEEAVRPKVSHWTLLEPQRFERMHGATITKLNDQSLLFTGDNIYRDEYLVSAKLPVANVTGMKIEAMPDAASPKGGPGRGERGEFLLSEFDAVGVAEGDAPTTTEARAAHVDPHPDPLPKYREREKAQAAVSDDPNNRNLGAWALNGRRGATTRPVVFESATADAGDNAMKAIDGKRDTHWTVPGGDGREKCGVFVVKGGLNGAAEVGFKLVSNYHQPEGIGRVRLWVTSDEKPVASGVPVAIEKVLLVEKAKRSPAQAEQLRRYFLATTPLLKAEHDKVAALRASMPAYQTTLVMQERAVPRVTRIHHRGEFLQEREVVEPGVPAVLPQLPKGERADRLALAKWLVDPENPLIGRVTMNRVWCTYFGRGIVNTVEDFGVMGEKPSHPELLDWLATELIRQHWSMKAMHKLIVTSATYRQASRVTEELKEKDPQNVLYARGPRLRVEAEVVRDVALAASGLLDEKVGGPSVFPPQADGITQLSYGPMAWVTSTGGDRYRRGLYTYLKRTSLYPHVTTFDGPTAEVVCPRRVRSNTPLQALTTLNDPVFVEAAQAMARRVVSQAPSDEADRARYAFKLAVAREPKADELKMITGFFETEEKRFKEKGADPWVVAGVEKGKAPAGASAEELAAWTAVSRAILNLDETITKE